MDSKSSEKKEVRVTIFNQTFSLRTTGDERETLEIANAVDELMNTIARRSSNLDTGRVAILACLHLTDQLRLAEGDLEQLKGRIEEKSRDFTLRLDRALGTG
jgi:cell division protein ZapA (FtsZ GTPase activity inhibitor)